MTTPAWEIRKSWGSGSRVDRSLGPPTMPCSPCAVCYRPGVITAQTTNTQGHTWVHFTCDCGQQWQRRKPDAMAHGQWKRRLDTNRNHDT